MPQVFNIHRKLHSRLFKSDCQWLILKCVLDVKFIMDYESVRNTQSQIQSDNLLIQIIPTIIQQHFYFQACKLHLGQTLRFCPEADDDGDFWDVGFKERGNSSDQITLKCLWVPRIIFLSLYTSGKRYIKIVFRSASPMHAT